MKHADSARIETSQKRRGSAALVTVMSDIMPARKVFKKKPSNIAVPTILDLRKTPTTPDSPAASISQFSLVGEATASPPQEKQTSESLLDEPGDGTILRKSSKPQNKPNNYH